jgi:hypothetical protein
MRTRRLRGLTLAVLAAHAIAWQLAAGRRAAPAPARAGVHRVALIRVAPREQVAAAPSGKALQPEPEPAHAPATARARATPARRAPMPARRAPTGAGGALRRGAPAAAAWPTYATQVPPSATLRYALVQTGPAASAAGTAELEWRRDAATFSLRLAAAVDGKPLREWQSTGGFDAAGVAPARLVEREKGRDRRAVGFDRAGGVVRLAGAPGAPAVARGAQDRWSWVAQLAAIAEAAAGRHERPTHWDLQVAGLRGELERWTFRVVPPGDPPPELRQGNQLSRRPDRAPALLHLLRATEQPYDLRIEAWLSPSLHHLPAGLRMSTPPGPWSLSLWRRDP